MNLEGVTSRIRCATNDSRNDTTRLLSRASPPFAGVPTLLVASSAIPHLIGKSKERQGLSEVACSASGCRSLRVMREGCLLRAAIQQLPERQDADAEVEVPAHAADVEEVVRELLPDVAKSLVVTVPHLGEPRD